MNIEEYVPAINPNMIGSANSLIVETPNIASITIATKVVKVVKIVLVNVSFMLILVILEFVSD